MPLLQMLRDYGALIGPTIGLVVAVVMLWVKERFDRHAATKKADRRLAKIGAMLREVALPTFQNPSMAADRISAMLENAVQFSRFYDHIAAVEGVLASAEPSIHESGSVELTMRYYRLKRSLKIIMDERLFVRKPTPGSSPIPDEDNFLNVRQEWLSLLAATEAERQNRRLVP